MPTTPSSLTWNLNPNTNLTKGVLWQGQISVAGPQVTATIDPNPHGVFTVASISRYVTIHGGPGGGGGRFPAIRTPLNPKGTSALPGTPEVTSELVQRALGAGPLIVSANESIVVEVNADATVGTGKLPTTAMTQGTNEFTGTLHILGLGAAVTVPLTLDLCQASTYLYWTGQKNPELLLISEATATLSYGALQTQVTLAPPGINQDNPLTFWLQQWGGELYSGLDSSLSRNDLLFPAPGGPAPVGVPYPYVPLQFIVGPTASKPAIPFQSPPNLSPEKKSPPDVKFNTDRTIASNSNNGVGILFFVETQFNGDIQNFRPISYAVPFL